MTTVPLPDVPCVRIGLTGTITSVGDWGTRFYLKYSGSAPSGADCIALGTAIGTAYGANLLGLAAGDVLLSEVDVIDIATHSGASAAVPVSYSGTRGLPANAASVATNIEYGIARRYRGGKPRGYWPFGVAGDLTTYAKWSNAFVTACNTDIAAFFSAINALSIGSMGTLAHVNLSYYHGFTLVTNTSGRSRDAPTYKATATHDDIVGYSTKQLISSQTRRRNATTP